MKLNKYKLLLLIFIIGKTFTHSMHIPLNFILDFIKPGNLVFDVGAHHGNKTELYLAAGAEVICFEPQPECINKLKEKFSRNPKVTIEQCGLSFKDDILTFYFSNSASTLSTFSVEWTEHSRFSKHGYKWDKVLQIPVTTLDFMIAKYGLPQFCKIDVENYELEVLQGLTKPIPYISFEFATESFHKTEKCIRHLQALGYKGFNVAFGESTHWLFTYWIPAETFLATLKQCCIEDVYIRDPWGIWGDVYACYNPTD